MSATATTSTTGFDAEMGIAHCFDAATACPCATNLETTEKGNLFELSISAAHQPRGPLWAFFDSKEKKDAAEEDEIENTEARDVKNTEAHNIENTQARNSDGRHVRSRQRAETTCGALHGRE